MKKIFKKGEKVFSTKHGWGTVKTDQIESKPDFPFIVAFDRKAKDGREYISLRQYIGRRHMKGDEHPELFRDECTVARYFLGVKLKQ